MADARELSTAWAVATIENPNSIPLNMLIDREAYRKPKFKTKAELRGACLARGSVSVLTLIWGWNISAIETRAT